MRTKVFLWRCVFSTNTSSSLVNVVVWLTLHRSVHKNRGKTGYWNKTLGSEEVDQVCCLSSSVCNIMCSFIGDMLTYKDTVYSSQCSLCSR